MLLPVIFMAAMVMPAALSLKSELVNGTVTITIKNFDEACESSRFVPGEPRKMVEGIDAVIYATNETTTDVETLFRHMLEELCPYVGYFPVKKEESIIRHTLNDTFESDYHVDDITMNSKINKTTEKSIYTDDIVNNTSELTSTTESIIKPTNKSDKIIVDIKLDSLAYENATDTIFKLSIDSSSSTPNDKSHSTVDDKPIKFMKNTTPLTMYSKKSDTTEKSRDFSIKNVSEYISTTESTAKPTNASDGIISDIKLDSLHENVTETISKIESTVSAAKEKNHSFTVDETETSVDSAMTVTTTVKPLILTKNTKFKKETNESTVDDRSSIDDVPKILTTTKIPVNRNSTILKNTTLLITETKNIILNKTLTNHKNVLFEEVENSTKSVTMIPTSESTIRTTKYKVKQPVTDEDMTSTTSVYGYEFTNGSDLIRPVYEDKSEIKDETVLTLTSSNTTSKVVFSEKSDSSEENEFSSTSEINYDDHTEDEIIVVVINSGSTKFDEGPTATTASVQTEIYMYDYDDKETYDEASYVPPEKIEPTTIKLEEDWHSTFMPSSSKDYDNKIETKLMYEHDTEAVDERRKIVVAVFVTVLLILSLIWAVKLLYRRHKGSYVLPQEDNNDMELGHNSTENPTK